MDFLKLYNPRLVYFLTQVIPAIRRSFSWFLSPFVTNPINTGFVYVGTLSSWCYKTVRAQLACFLPQLVIICFSAHTRHSQESGLETRVCILAGLVATALSFF